MSAQPTDYQSDPITLALAAVGRAMGNVPDLDEWARLLRSSAFWLSAQAIDAVDHDEARRLVALFTALGDLAEALNDYRQENHDGHQA